jgi:transcriptional regulator with XRE-family HTH domain
MSGKARLRVRSRTRQGKVAVLELALAASGDGVAARVAHNLRRLRSTREMSLDELAGAAGVSRAAVAHIESSKGNPTIGVLFRIATGLGVPFAELLAGPRDPVGVLRRAETHVLYSADRQVESRPLTRAGSLVGGEIYELRLAPHAKHLSDPHARGTREVVVVVAGVLRLHVGTAQHELGPGDSVCFDADESHTYENPGAEVTLCHDFMMYDR